MKLDERDDTWNDESTDRSMTDASSSLPPPTPPPNMSMRGVLTAAETERRVDEPRRGDWVSGVSIRCGLMGGDWSWSSETRRPDEPRLFTKSSSGMSVALVK
jgi:hypothetical protein